MMVHPLPPLRNVYTAWQAVEIGEDEYSELAALLHGTPWDIWLEKHGLVVRHGDVAWHMDIGDYVVKAPWGHVVFLSAEQFKEDFECLGQR